VKRGLSPLFLLILCMGVGVYAGRGKNERPRKRLRATELEQLRNPLLEEEQLNDRLFQAVCRGCVDDVRRCIDARADVNARTFLEPESPLGEPAPTSSWLFRFMMDGGPEFNRHAREGTPLYLAARGGHEEVVRVLLDAGAKIEETSGYHWQTPLHAAARRGFDGVVRVLLEAGADVAAETHFLELTPLDLATDEGVIQLLKEHVGEKTS